ncbi:SH3 domain-containing protein [Streptomyces sp. KR80]|uniref:SH3 domain-containing protein n=1 Tax=Streptomyces sp. KR80 TaxID=3457426 RepID=UPI003FD0875A
MHLQSKLSKFAFCAATGVLATMTAAAPAIATDDPEPTGGGKKRIFHGKVLAKKGLNVRSAPNTHARVIRVLKHGAIVKIKCKVNSQVIDGNPRWYRLADGSWAWASARYIKNLDGIPPFCRKPHKPNHLENVGPVG